MQIKINLQIFLFIVLFVLTHQIGLYACVMVFALIHEMGHMCAGIFLKLKPKSINLMPFGISLTFEAYGYKKLIEIKKIIIALAGPVTNLIICIVTIFLNINSQIKEIIIYSNILVAIFNLIPIYPLDGGRVLKNVLKILLGSIKANKYTNKISNICMVILTVLGSVFVLIYKNIAIVLLITALWFMIIRENKRYNTFCRVYKVIDKKYNYL